MNEGNERSELGGQFVARVHTLAATRLTWAIEGARMSTLATAAPASMLQVFDIDDRQEQDQ